MAMCRSAYGNCVIRRHVLERDELGPDPVAAAAPKCDDEPPAPKKRLLIIEVAGHFATHSTAVIAALKGMIQ